MHVSLFPYMHYECLSHVLVCSFIHEVMIMMLNLKETRFGNLCFQTPLKMKSMHVHCFYN